MESNHPFINQKDLDEPKIMTKIDQLIQQIEAISVPAIVFECTSKENIDFDYNDLKNFFTQFGEIEIFEIKGKTCFILFKNFFSANVCKEFLLKKNNFKETMQNNFSVRWFNIESDTSLLNDEQKETVQSISKKNSVNLSKINMPIQINMNLNNKIIPNSLQQTQNIPSINPNINNQFIQNSITNGMGMNINVFQGMQMHNQQNQIGQNINMKIQPIPPQFLSNQNYIINLMAKQQAQNIPNHYQQQPNLIKIFKQMSSDFIEEKGNYGKFTCKFEILIPNDQEFQVVRKLIGSKGCNMKKIVDSCKSDTIGQSNVKLRLRGRGSGYKEGPQNKESDEPLHLCISAKNQESLKLASNLVCELIDKIYEDYKKYCNKVGITPLPKIANKIDGGNTMHLKNNMNMTNNMHSYYIQN